MSIKHTEDFKLEAVRIAPRTRQSDVTGPTSILVGPKCESSPP
jgi:hypothetical protein